MQELSFRDVPIEDPAHLVVQTPMQTLMEAQAIIATIQVTQKSVNAVQSIIQAHIIIITTTNQIDLKQTF